MIVQHLLEEIFNLRKTNPVSQIDKTLISLYDQKFSVPILYKINVVPNDKT